MRQLSALLSRAPIAALLGVVLGLAIAFGVVRLVPCRAMADTPPQLGGAPLPEEEGPLTEVLFHYLPEIEEQLREPYQDFLGTLPPDTRLVALVPGVAGARETELSTSAPRGAASASLYRFLDSIDPRLRPRTQVVRVEGPISPWSKDRALVLGPAPGRSFTTLLTPTKPPKQWTRRVNDWRTINTFAATRSEYVSRNLPLDFDAGDFAVTRRGVLVDVNLVAKNHDRQVASPADLEHLLEPLLGTDIIVLGQEDGDVPRHHLSMYMTPLGQHRGRDVVIVGDPRLAQDIVGTDFVPGEIDPDTGEPLHADFSDTMVERHERAARDLAAAGFEVVRIPTVPFLDKTYMAYTNGIYASWGTQKVAWVPSFGLPELDARARAVYEGLGWEVRPVRVRSVYAFHGTIGCLVNVLSRATVGG